MIHRTIRRRENFRDKRYKAHKSGLLKLAEQQKKLTPEGNILYLKCESFFLKFLLQKPDDTQFCICEKTFSE